MLFINTVSLQFFHAPLRQHIQTHLHHTVEVTLHAWNNQTLCIRPGFYQNYQPLFKFPACCSAERSKVLTPSSAILNTEPQLHSDRGRSKALSFGFIHGRCAYFSDDPLLWGASCRSWCWGGLTMSWAAYHSCPSLVTKIYYWSQFPQNSFSAVEVKMSKN